MTCGDSDGYGYVNNYAHCMDNLRCYVGVRLCVTLVCVYVLHWCAFRCYICVLPGVTLLCV